MSCWRMTRWITRLMAVDDARDAGARALFGEKYGDEVRVVSMGKTAREHGSNVLGWSVELCGGTHVKRTGDIGLISVTGESAVASGVRRIEALTGNHARRHANDTMALRQDRGGRTAHTLDEMPARIAALMEERKKLERDLSEARKKLAMGGGAQRSTDRRSEPGPEVGDVNLMARASKASRARTSRASSTTARSRSAPAWSPSSASPRTARPASWSASPPISPRASTRSISSRSPPTALGGKGGGGRPDMAQAGGPDGANADEALTAIAEAMGGA